MCLIDLQSHRVAAEEDGIVPAEFQHVDWREYLKKTGNATQGFKEKLNSYLADV